MASENDRHEAYKNYIAANESTVLRNKWEFSVI